MHETLETLAEEVLDAARERGVTLGCAESCTGGMIAAALTSIAGSSDSFVGGVVSYWISVKESTLHVDDATIEAHGVVSEEVACEMSIGARETLNCDYAVATTGIAGPTGALPGKPVGTVCYAIATPSGVSSETTCMGATRGEVRSYATKNALCMLREAITSDIQKS